MNRKLIAILPAAGIGARAVGAEQDVTLPKQYRLLKGQAMLRWSVVALLQDERIDQVRVILAPGDTWGEKELGKLPRTVLRYCGGASRADTVTNALQELALQEQDWVIVHDAARPGLPAQSLRALIDTCLGLGQGGLLALPVPDTVKRGAPAGQSVLVQATVDRENLWLAQTPQMFPAALLKQALLDAQTKQAVITDEASAIELFGQQPILVVGSARNFKVTWPEDFELMEKWL
ncbi:2-C-methyl-D-erythritol 4-phosphate cytidylyltransferase [Alcaligenes endophyticus]|uniref:2-C-methyl-D-erythritol 4-phosphate cytidylyltransferase n=1 Tax=Alcaligenes endophyticus TaxID=1929088 RepID=A0ABT8EHL6_9BURK|nr:2-C-methyl-D-erythritol 4-phosphate cytidylyltransferase [Alcaligenes endophyticus]MCX5592129.1 2-C-methyl-D-erythritol 4-phosphate cytidylyltransferase [Alcaligenes endophyticus]MDN4120776.1 2-C-methyl-D-erythritol 4-phosphate cytidylyltransferase [Alcaligenes endophyticus]